MLFLKDSLELHSLKTGNLAVLPYFCCVQKILFPFISMGGLIRVYWPDQQEAVYVPLTELSANEILDAELFTQFKPLWVDDLGTRK